ncbi:hypothetical protein [Paenibacillus dendritiformis]|uniref:hypothetical protein n=1 Tax=Paenibacillus dendritiformis TaxID=130049 RepID=UPI0011B73B52|nr:hypothetical protein [Paenibacillus dendritiformis]
MHSVYGEALVSFIYDSRINVADMAAEMGAKTALVSTKGLQPAAASSSSDPMPKRRIAMAK